MQFDLVIIAIMMLFMGIGFKNGAVYTLFHAFGWLFAIVAAFLLRGFTADLIREHSAIYDKHFENILGQCTAFVDKHLANISENVPSILADNIDSLTEKAVLEIATTITDVTFSLMVLIGLIVAIKIVIYIIIRLLSKRNRDGFRGALDGLAGAALGFFQGACVVFVLLAMLGPVSFSIGEDTFDQAGHILNKSIFTEILYERNPLFLLTGEENTREVLSPDWLDPDALIENLDFLV
jgi:uncharacterized membrane protein required for colicin V production